MDGDVVDIESLRNLAEKFNCYLYIDEAHATGVLGKSGFGITELESKKIKKKSLSVHLVRLLAPTVHIYLLFN